MARKGSLGFLKVMAAVLVGVVGLDVALRVSGRPGPEAPPAEVEAGVAEGRVPSQAEPPADRSDAPERSRTRERVARASGGTYLPDMLRDSDSLLRRWPDERIGASPVRVAIIRAPRVTGFREAFAANVSWALTRWNGSNLPVRLQAGADSSRADIVITWVERMDSLRTGRVDLTWDRRGHIRRALVFLATHTPDGRALDESDMTAVALHELGHALGLGHSPIPGDALHAVAVATDLSDRDRRTARLLYDLPPGSLR